MNLPSFCAKYFCFALAAVVAGCAMPGNRETVKNHSPVPPQEFANIDIQHDRTSYRSSFPVDLTRTVPVLFIVGDSTVHNYDGGRVGWGDAIGNYFDTNKIIVENHALAGRSSRTFITQGWWNLLLKEARPGDFMLLQMGHNDAGALDDTNRARGSIPGIGSEQKEIYNPVRHKQEIVHTYGWYLRKYISDARAHGITPIICSPVPHVPKTKVQPGDVEKFPYVNWSREVAGNQKVAFINLNQCVMNHYTGMTPQEIKESYFTHWDNTHSSAAGAKLNAACVVDEVRGLSDCALKNYLR